MLWRDDVPTHASRDADGRATEVTVAAGQYRDRARAGPAAAVVGVARRHRRRDLDDPHGAARALHAAARGAAGESLAVLLPRAPRSRSPGAGSTRTRASCWTPAADVGARGGRRRRGAAAAAGQAHRRARRAVRPVRDEHARRDPAGDAGLPAHAVRRLAVAERRSRARARAGRFARHADGRVENAEEEREAG